MLHYRKSGEGGEESREGSLHATPPSQGERLGARDPLLGSDPEGKWSKEEEAEAQSGRCMVCQRTMRTSVHS